MIVEATARAAAPYEVAVERAVAHLRAHGWDAAATSALGENQPVLIRAGLAGVTKRVAVYALEPITTPGQTVIPFRWVATGTSGGVFPPLEADLRLRPVNPGATELIVVGSYQPPFGTIGAEVDHLLMSRVARRTLSAFLDRLVEVIGSPGAVQETPRAVAEPEGDG